MDWRASALSLVTFAIEGKYGPDSYLVVTRRMAPLFPLLEKAASEAELRSYLAPPSTPERDIDNQLIVIALIEKWWIRAGHPSVGIGEMHRVLFGDLSVDPFREKDLISDFGGQTLTPWTEVASRMDEVERVCRELSGGVELLPMSVKAQLLSYLFASIIRIHPFPDGNGRTARMYAQYLLRMWGYTYLIIPKVRNDEAWRVALEAAVLGDIVALKQQFMRRLVQAEATDSQN